MAGPWEHNRWRWAYAYGACGWAPAPPEDCDHWSPDLQARAFAAADDEELQAVYEEQMADYQRQMEYAYYMEKARRRAQEADLERQTAPWGQRWY